MTTYIRPDIGSFGTFQLDEPFATKLVSNVAYECIALRSMDDVVKEGVDPYAKYYSANNLTEAKYLADKEAGVVIVTLRSTAGAYVYVPTSYVKSYPLSGGIPYQVTGILVDLGALPTTLDLTVLKTTIVDVVHNSLGVTASTSEIAMSDLELLSTTMHTTYEAVRKQAITVNESDYTAKLRLEKENITLTKKIAELETYILSTTK